MNNLNGQRSHKFPTTLLTQKWNEFVSSYEKIIKEICLCVRETGPETTRQFSNRLEKQF